MRCKAFNKVKDKRTTIRTNYEYTMTDGRQPKKSMTASKHKATTDGIHDDARLGRIGKVQND